MKPETNKEKYAQLQKIEEYELEGELKVSLKCREVRSTTSYKEGKVKDLAYKGLNGNVKAPVLTSDGIKKDDIDTGNFNNVEDDLPF